MNPRAVASAQSFLLYVAMGGAMGIDEKRRALRLSLALEQFLVQFRGSEWEGLLAELDEKGEVKAK